METFFLVCFVLGLVMSVMAVFAGGGHLHLGHLHIGHVHTGKPTAGGAFNGFTMSAFLCWFGGAGYLMMRAGVWPSLWIVFFAGLSGVAGGSLVYAVLYKILMPRERVLTPEDTEMTGVVARVSDQIRLGGVGEILYSQMGARKSAAARSEDGGPIPRNAEVLVLRYERGIAYVRVWDEARELEQGSPVSRTALHE